MRALTRKDKAMVALLLTGDLGDVNLAIVFDSLSSDMNEFPDESIFDEIYRLVIHTLRHLLMVAYITKQVLNDPDSFCCSIEGEGE